METVCEGPEMPSPELSPGFVSLWTTMLQLNFERTGKIEYINEAIQRLESVLDTIPEGNADRPMLLNNLANRLASRYDCTREVEDLSRAIELGTEVLNIVHKNHPRRSQRSMLLNNLGNRLGQRFERSAQLDDLHRAVELISEAVDTSPPESEQRIGWQCNLTYWYGVRSEWTGSLEDLNHAIAQGNSALTSIDTIHIGHQDRPGVLSTLGNQLGVRYGRTGVPADLDQAVKYTGEAVKCTPDGYIHKAKCLNNWATWLAKRFEREGQLDDLNEAIGAVDTALSSTLDNRLAERASYLSNLGKWLHCRFKRTGSIDDLDRAVDVVTRAVEIGNHDMQAWHARLVNLANILETRFERFGQLEDLTRAIDLATRAVECLPEDNQSHPIALTTLGSLLDAQSQWTQSIDDINQAVDIMERTVRLMDPNNQDLPTVLSNLGIRLARRFEQTGSMDDLDRATLVSRLAVEKTPLNHRGRAMRINNLGLRLGQQFRSTGSLEILNEAVEIIDQAVLLTSPDNPDRVQWLTNLANRLTERFNWTGALEDITRTTEIRMMIVDATPVDHADRPDRLNNLATTLGTLFPRAGSMADLDRAIEVAEDAITASAPEHPKRLIYMHTKAMTLAIQSDQFRQAGKPMDAASSLDQAVNLLKITVESTPKDHSEYWARLNPLGILLAAVFERTGVKSDLDQSIAVLEESLQMMPSDHPTRAETCSTLANFVYIRAHRFGIPKDYERAVAACNEGISNENAAPSTRIRCALQGAPILAHDSRWEEATVMLERAIELLPKVSLHSISNTDKQHELSQFAGLGGMAAAMSLNAGRPVLDALLLLERARGVISSLLLDMRSDISVLQTHHPLLAERFRKSRGILDLPSQNRVGVDSMPNASDSPTWEVMAKQRRDAEREYLTVINEIRAIPGFENFLQSPSMTDIKRTANAGPVVVINMSTYRCDAILITPQDITLLELPNLQLQIANRMAQALQNRKKHPVSATDALSALTLLWNVLAQPCLDKLGFCETVHSGSQNLPHVWWIPTGPLCHLPIHAAGDHIKGHSHSVMDRVISSYSSSIKSLIRGRQRPISSAAQTEPGIALLIAMEKTPGQKRLRYAADESAVVEALCASLNLTACRASSHQREPVLKALQKCTVFHFAGHGRTDALEPSQSCLLLDDWGASPLTVADLRDGWLGENTPPFLGYLSACSTGSNLVHNLVDEAVHLASGCQLAGFRHVVGTLWEVHDQCCLDVAQIFYETLRDEGMTDEAVAKALHKAVRTLRDRAIERVKISRAMMEGPRDAELVEEMKEIDLSVADPWSWAPYIHFGM